MVAASPASATSYPNYVFNTVHDGDTVSGQVPVRVTGYLDPAGTQQWNQVTFFVDGVQAGAAQQCTNQVNGITCMQAITWDTTGLSGTHVITEDFQYRDGNTTGDYQAPALHLTVSALTPTSTITAPSTGSTIAGYSYLTVHSVIPAALSDTADYVRVYVDDYAQIIGDTCVGQADNHVCDLQLPWDGSAWANGPHTFQAELHTAIGETYRGPKITLDLENPAVSGQVTAPTDGQTVSGTVNITATGTVPSVRTEHANSFQWILDNTWMGSASCLNQTDTHLCSVSIPWDTTTTSPGAHTLKLVFFYDNGQVQLTPVAVTVIGTSHLTVAAPLAKAGATISGHGTVTDGTGHALAGVPVSITVTPVVGTVRFYQVTSTSTGAYAWSFPASTNASISATVAAGATWGASSAHAVAGVYAPMTCTWTTKIVHGHKATGSCAIKYLPAGTRYALQVKSGTRWKTIVNGKSGRGGVAFSLLEAKRGTAYLRFAVTANRYWAATTGPTLKVTIS